MDMQINSKLIKQERHNRAWSQGQLAELSGLSLRTIQRIEKEGTASLESLKALAATLEIDILRLRRTNSGGEAKKSKLLAAAVSLLALFTGIFTLVPASAQDIRVDVMIMDIGKGQGGKVIGQGQFVNQAGVESEMLIEDRLRLVVKAHPENDTQIRLTMDMFKLENGGEQLLGTPELIVKNNHTAEVNTEQFVILLKPKS